jgi:hypothetical protein
MVLPKPFTGVYVFAGRPLCVPPGLSRAQLEPYRAKLQLAMDELNGYAERLAAGEPVEQRELSAAA